MDSVLRVMLEVTGLFIISALILDRLEMQWEIDLLKQIIEANERDDVDTKGEK